MMPTHCTKQWMHMYQVYGRTFFGRHDLGLKFQKFRLSILIKAKDKMCKTRSGFSKCQLSQTIAANQFALRIHGHLRDDGEKAAANNNHDRRMGK